MASKRFAQKRDIWYVSFWVNFIASKGKETVHRIDWIESVLA